ncbi:GNAT family protein [Shimia sp. NS0008-38b]|uniref:GNAT family N-acetyltransferase n=1 Tax=Shimia sp. NS0008-38b TaxID=3127653 RepID=UPI0031027DA6
MNNTSFETERLTLRSCRMEDATALQALMTPDISAWVAVWPTPLSLSATEAILMECIAAMDAGHTFAALVEEKATGLVIGWLKLDITSANNVQTELGYWIGESFQRRGYAMEMSKGAIAFAFDTLGVKNVRAGAQVTNTASLNLLQKLGMTEDSVERVWAPARQRHEACTFWVLDRPT